MKQTSYCLFTFIKLHPEVLIDQEDLLRLGIYLACFNGNGYVIISYEGRQELLHRVIMGLPNCDVDHKNRITIDNRKENLRPATDSQNRANANHRIDNTSGYKGVSWHKARKNWRAQITVKGEKRHLGSFDTAERAAIAYNKAALKYFGEFACLNNIEKESPK